MLDSAAAITRARSDNTGPGQWFATVIIGVCSLLASRENTLMSRWVPSHLGIERNETSDGWARNAAEDVADSVASEYLRETSFAHMARRPRKVGRLAVDHADR